MELTQEAINELETLTPDVIDALSVVRAKVKEAEELEEELTFRIKKIMAAEEIFEYAPRSSQQKLVIRAVPTALVPWQKEWEKLARSKWGKRWTKVMLRLKRIYRKPVFKLVLERNERHGEIGKGVMTRGTERSRAKHL
jgi:hypothetical protein